MEVIDIYSGSWDWIERELSNFTEHPFTFDGVYYRTIEAFLQSLKYENPPDINGLRGHEVYKFCHNHIGWKKDLTMWYKGKPIHRLSDAYSNLIYNAYLSMAEQNKGFLEALVHSKPHILAHTMGCKDPHHTILTEKEFCDILTEIRELI